MAFVRHLMCVTIRSSIVSRRRIRILWTIVLRWFYGCRLGFQIRYSTGMRITLSHMDDVRKGVTSNPDLDPHLCVPGTNVHRVYVRPLGRTYTPCTFCAWQLIRDLVDRCLLTIGSSIILTLLNLVT
jgi:hypothetical protein